MSWTKKNVHPGKIVSQSQEVEVQVLEVDPNKRRISLGFKQTMANPWEVFAEKYPVGTELVGEVKNITEFGLFLGLDGDVDGLVHLSDIAWDKSGEEAIGDYKKGDEVKAVVLDVDTEKERISLGIKQLSDDPFASAAQQRRGDVVTCTVAEVQPMGIEVTYGDRGLKAFIRKNDLARDRSEQRPERFAVGDKVDAQIVNIDRSSRRVTLSIKAREISEEKEAVAQYGSTDSGASLGDILGAALNKAKSDNGGKAAPAKEEAPAEEKAAAKEEAPAEAAPVEEAAATPAEEAPAEEAPAEEAEAKAETKKAKKKKDD
jgi:small subunit ribosomal protein S1